MARFDDDDDDDDRPVRKKVRPRRSNIIVDFLLFKYMVGPWVLLVLYWIAAILLILGGFAVIIISIIAAARQGGAIALLGALYGLLAMLIYPVALRVYVELAICVFRIYETLQEIRDKL